MRRADILKVVTIQKISGDNSGFKKTKIGEAPIELRRVFTHTGSIDDLMSCASLVIVGV